MKTNFDYIDQRVKEFSSGSTKVITNYAGFEMETTVDVETDAFRTYKRQAAELTENLTNLGIKPITVLPRSVWTSIVEQADLIETYGRQVVALDGRAYSGLLNFIYRSMMIGMLLAVAVGTFVGSASVVGWLGGLNVWAAVSSSSEIPGLAVSALIAGIVTGGIAAIAAAAHIEDPLTIAAAWIVSKMFDRDKMFKAMYDESKKRSSAPSWGFKFPSPPAAETEVLSKLAANAQNIERAIGQIRVVAVPKAFQLNVPMSAILAQALGTDLAEKAELRRLIAADPIVYITAGMAVAIVAQYGEFPIEKEMVDKAIVRGEVKFS